MSRRLLVALTAALMAAPAALVAVGAQPSPSSVLKIPVQQVAPAMEQMAQIYGSSFNATPPPVGQTPEQRAQWLMNVRPTLGKTPADWLHQASATFSVSEAAKSAARGLTLPAADLTTEVLRTYALVGHRPTVADRTALATQAAGVPSPVRTDFAGLLAVVNNAYAAQLPIVAAVKARWEAGFDPHVPLLTTVERDAMAQREAAITAALNHFRAVDVPQLTSTSSAKETPLFADPEGLVILGSTGNDTYGKTGLVGDPVLLVDPAGSDTYTNSAGGACPFTPSAFGSTWLTCNTLVVSIVADLGDGSTTPSNDSYTYNGSPAAVQGAGGPGGIGMLVDVGGNDTYRATMTRGNVQPFEPVLYYFDGGAQGYGYAGDGLLLDGTGSDYYDFTVNSTSGYSIWELGQGFGAAGGVGLAIDGAGSDQWRNDSLGGVTGFGFEGMYTQGTGFYGGVGIIEDLGGAGDVYHALDTANTTDYYAQGFGAFGGLGIQYDDGGNDNYFAVERASNPTINPLLNCAFGTGSYAGVGIMVDGGGNDVYYGETTSSASADIDDWGAGHPGMSYGLFLDAGGSDSYTEKTVSTGGGSTSNGGLGLWKPGFGNLVDSPLGENTFGTFLDLGGAVDTYTGAPWASNNSVWNFGVDR